MRKKVFAALLAVCMVVSMLPVSAFAESVDLGVEFFPASDGFVGQVNKTQNPSIADAEKNKMFGKTLAQLQSGTPVFSDPIEEELTAEDQEAKYDKAYRITVTGVSPYFQTSYPEYNTWAESQMGTWGHYIAYGMKLTGEQDATLSVMRLSNPDEEPQEKELLKGDGTKEDWLVTKLEEVGTMADPYEDIPFKIVKGEETIKLTLDVSAITADMEEPQPAISGGNPGNDPSISGFTKADVGTEVKGNTITVTIGEDNGGSVKAHNNGATPPVKGYWVGVNFEAPKGMEVQGKRATDTDFGYDDGQGSEELNKTNYSYYVDVSKTTQATIAIRLGNMNEKTGKFDTYSEQEYTLDFSKVKKYVPGLQFKKSSETNFADVSKYKVTQDGTNVTIEGQVKYETSKANFGGDLAKGYFVPVKINVNSADKALIKRITIVGDLTRVWGENKDNLPAGVDAEKATVAGTKEAFFDEAGATAGDAKLGTTLIMRRVLKDGKLGNFTIIVEWSTEGMANTTYTIDCSKLTIVEAKAKAAAPALNDTAILGETDVTGVTTNMTQTVVAGDLTIDSKNVAALPTGTLKYVSAWRGYAEKANCTVAESAGNYLVLKVSDAETADAGETPINTVSVDKGIAIDNEDGTWTVIVKVASNSDKPVITYGWKGDTKTKTVTLDLTALTLEKKIDLENPVVEAGIGTAKTEVKSNEIASAIKTKKDEILNEADKVGKEMTAEDITVESFTMTADIDGSGKSVKLDTAAVTALQDVGKVVVVADVTVEMDPATLKKGPSGAKLVVEKTETSSTTPNSLAEQIKSDTGAAINNLKAYEVTLEGYYGDTAEVKDDSITIKIPYDNYNANAKPIVAYVEYGTGANSTKVQKLHKVDYTYEPTTKSLVIVSSHLSQWLVAEPAQWASVDTDLIPAAAYSVGTGTAGTAVPGYGTPLTVNVTGDFDGEYYAVFSMTVKAGGATAQFVAPMPLTEGQTSVTYLIPSSVTRVVVTLFDGMPGQGDAIDGASAEVYKK